MDENLSASEAYLWVALGIVISLLIPIIVKAIKKSTGSDVAAAGIGSTLWNFAKPYLLIAALAALVAVLIVSQFEFEDARAAVLGGYAWDATLQKIKAGWSKGP